MSDEFDKRLKKLDRLLGLSEILPRPVGKLSGGQRRKADIARALLHEPELLILDEPTTGLDPKTRRDLWNAVTLLQKERGMTVFFDHPLHGRGSIADYVVIIDEGKTVAEGTPNQLKNLYAVDYLTVYGVPRDKLDALGVQYEKTGDGVRISVSSPAEATRIISSHPNYLSTTIRKRKNGRRLPFRYREKIRGSIMINTLFIFIKRNIKLFFKDKGLFFVSLITPIILLILFVTFLANVYEDSFRSAINAISPEP